LTGQMIRKALRVALALVLAADLSGCVSVSSTRTKATGPAGGDGSLDVAVYDTPAQAKAGIPTSGSVSLDLGRLDRGQPERPLQSSSSPAASFGSLAPGEYSLHLKAVAPQGGGSATPPTITQESIRVAAGETVHTRVILKKFPTVAVVSAVLCVGAVIGIAYGVAASKLSGLGSHLSRSPATRTEKAHKR
jgi:hypothetical protein